MKKLLSVILMLSILILLLAASGCRDVYYFESSITKTFPAIIRSISGNHIIVEGLPENDVNHTWQFQFSIDENVKVLENGKKISAELLEVGDMIEITYTGSVLEISPAIIQNVLRIERTATCEEPGNK